MGDVASLLAKVGIAPSDTSEKAGTAAIAYAAHKAASPIRFPPTVALTPIVANWMGKKLTMIMKSTNKRCKNSKLKEKNNKNECKEIRIKSLILKREVSQNLKN